MHLRIGKDNPIHGSGTIVQPYHEELYGALPLWWGWGILVKSSLLKEISVQILDSTQEDILWLQLLDRYGSCVICICVCYPPPANSSRGDKSVEFFDRLKLLKSWNFNH